MCAQKWKEPHTLDLHNRYDFPGWSTLPPVDDAKMNGTTYTLLEIESNQSYLSRPVFRVKDRDNETFMAACYYDNDKVHLWNTARQEPGMCMALRNTYQHEFLDGSEGFRFEEPDECVQFTCTRTRLYEINSNLQDRPKDCNACKKPNSTSACARCKIAYCSKECQVRDWKAAHKRECEIVQQLRDWNEDKDPNWRMGPPEEDYDYDEEDFDDGEGDVTDENCSEESDT